MENKPRRHHNRTGLRQIKNGQTVKQVAAMARRLREENVVDITTISTEELQNDLDDSIKDISTCSLALARGITHYSGGSVHERLLDNRGFVNVITAELKRRGVEI
jgi:hypothetical protein